MIHRSNIPADGWAGFKENLGKDSLSGFLVFLLALPLSLGIAKASDFPAIFGLVTAIIGGIVVSFFTGSRLSIKGPAAGLIVIASGAVEAFGGGEKGWHLALGVVVVAGLVQVLFGVFKLGSLADFFPSAAIHGMLAAIGIIIISKQVHVLLGIPPAEIAGKEPLELLAMIPQSLQHENAHLTEIGVACLAILILFSYIKHNRLKKIPGPLVVLFVAIPLGQILHIKTEGQISNFALVKVGNIFDAYKERLFLPDFSGITQQTGVFIQYVILFSLIGSIESLLTAKAIDHMDPFKRKSDFNKDIMSVGIGNTLSGILGGLPMISEVARSSANVGYGARTRWANFFHGLFLLISLLFAVPIIEMIPNAALAAMLTFIGYKLTHPREFIHMWHLGKDQLTVFVTTIIVTVSTDLLIGVLTGIILEMTINIFNGANLKNLFNSSIDLVKKSEEEYIIMIKNGLTFSNIISFQKKFAQLQTGKNITIDVSHAKIIDHTSLLTLNHLREEYKARNINLKITGFQNHRQLGHAKTSGRILKR